MSLAEDIRRQNAEELEQVSDLVHELERAGPGQEPGELRHKLAAYLAKRKARLAAGLKAPDGSEPGEEPAEGAAGESDPFADRQAFLRMKDWLLAHYPDEFVAFVGGKLTVHDRSYHAVIDQVLQTHPTGDAYIERVDEEGFEELPPADVGGVCEVWPLEDEPA